MEKNNKNIQAITRYNYFEEIKTETGIVQQKSTETNGSYFTIELKT